MNRVLFGLFLCSRIDRGLFSRKVVVKHDTFDLFGNLLATFRAGLDGVGVIVSV
jgi:hypothetical protein